MRPESSEVLARVLACLDRFSDGVHDLGEPAFLLDSELPASLAELYRSFDGGRLFHEELVLSPSAEVQLSGDRFLIGEVAGDDLFVERTGRVVEREKDTGDLLVCGTAIDRWLAGFVDSAALLYDHDGEFRDGVFTEAGEVAPAIDIKRQRCFMKRDPKAPGPRWRLARLLAAAGEIAEARRLLEDVAEAAPSFAWVWFDLAKISESLGELEGAYDEYAAAADVESTESQRAFFLAHAARVADDAERTEARELAAARALKADPQLIDGLLRAFESEVGAGASPARLLALAQAVAPRDLRVIDAARRLASASSPT